uniref:3-oxoacyl-[acyl-carrier-protein] reductase n=1 Tax=Odontella aurita TaxID=265563 RepID=A0A7S4MU31_9STRA|mmetsp:Transcript_31318/g.93799  ORF Transcript_31318/g.93799 Transcript_31318/m.93799 type:complete len:329 (+) Transcript_31318:123-1109(+)
MSSTPPPPRRIAIVTGGTRGIGRGISEALAATGEYSGFLLTYNTDKNTAESFAATLRSGNVGNGLRVEIVGGDLSLKETRDAVFSKFDKSFHAHEGFELSAVVHNAGQYIGITSDNTEGFFAPPGQLLFGDGSLLAASADGSPDLSTMKYYQRLYGDAYIDLCERGLDRMQRATERRRTLGNDIFPPFRGSLIGISGQGCNFNQRVSTSYDMPGSGKCVMEYAMRIFALRTAALGVNCNVIIPGVTRTDAWSRLEEKRGMPIGKLREMVVGGTVPMGEDIDPREIGDTVAFLCSATGGGRFITGVSLPVDGGLHLGKPPQSSFRQGSK